MESYKAMEMKENNKYVQLNSVIELVQRYGKDEFSKLDSFLATTCLGYSREKTRIYKEHDIANTDHFNFFESISDKWYRENFHSDVLYTILNPNTKEIGRKYFIQEFVKFLGIEDTFDSTKDCEVIKECSTGFISSKDNNGNETGQYGYIDLLIKNDTQAIIIENKVNYAPDMENQLVRYMKYVQEELNKEISAVVYLTLINDNNKKPPLESYDESFKSYKELLKNTRILKEIYAVDEQKSLAKDFLPACIKRLESEKTTNQKLSDSCTIASVYINQYKILLEHLGGIVYMSSTDKKLIQEIYSNKEKYEAAIDFAELWSKRDSLLEDILQSKYKEEFPNKGLPAKTTINGYKYYFWKIHEKDYFVYWSGAREIGFSSFDGESFLPGTENKLREIVDKIPNEKEVHVYNHKFISCVIKDTSTLIDDVMNALKLLFNA